MLGLREQAEEVLEDTRTGKSAQHTLTALLRQPVYDELMKLIKDKWWTRKTVKTGADGTARFRGFLGDYKNTVAVDEKTRTSRDVSLARNVDNRHTIRLK